MIKVALISIMTLIYFVAFSNFTIDMQNSIGDKNLIMKYKLPSFNKSHTSQKSTLFKLSPNYSPNKINKSQTCIMTVCRIKRDYFNGDDEQTYNQLRKNRGAAIIYIGLSGLFVGGLFALLAKENKGKAFGIGFGIGAIFVGLAKVI